MSGMRLRLFVLGLLCGASSSLFAESPSESLRQLILQAPPAAAVSSVAVSPDGSLVATAAGEGGVRLYDARSGKFLRTIGPVGDRCVVFSPDGRTLTAAGFHMDKLVRLWDVETGARLRNFSGQTEWEADATTISPDGKLLASTGVDKQILVWEIATGKLLLQLKDQPARMAALIFSPDGKTLAAGGGDKLVRLLDVATGMVQQSFTGHNDWVCAIAFSPDGRLLASGSCDWGFHRGHDWPRGPRGPEACEWRLWDVASGKARRTVKESGKLLSLAFAPDGKTLVCGIDKQVRSYDLVSNGDGHVVTSHDAEVTAVVITPDGSAVISGSHDQTIKRTSLNSASVEWQAPGYYEQVNSVTISDDGALLVTGSSDHRFAREGLKPGMTTAGRGAVRLWNVRTGQMLRRLGEPSEQIMAVAISADGKQVAAGGGTIDGTSVVRVWNADSGTLDWSSNDHSQEVLAISFSPDGKYIASGSADGVVRLHEAATGKVAQILSGHAGGATALAFSPDGRRLYCGQARGGVLIWDVMAGRLQETYKIGESTGSPYTFDRRMTSIGLSREGATLATCASSVNDEFVDPVRLWNTQTGALIRDFTAENTHGRPMARSPDGSLIATGGKSVRLRDARTGELLRELNGILKRTQSIVFSSDGRLIIAGGSYGTTNIWEVATGRPLVTLFAFPEQQNGATADAWLAYMPDGHYTGSANIEKYLAWRVGDEFVGPGLLSRELRRPEQNESALRSP